MAQDLFNDVNGTLLATHDSNWANINATFTVAECEIQNNAVNATTAAGQRSAGARYTTSNSDISEIVVDACNQSDARVGTWVRADGATLGYGAVLQNIVGGFWKTLTIQKNGSILTSSTVSIPATNQMSVQIVLTDNTTNVDLNAIINGASLLTSNDAVSIIPVGNPGFYVLSAAADHLQPSILEWNDAVGVPVVTGLTSPLVDGSTGNSFSVANFTGSISSITIASDGFSISPSVSGSGTGPYTFNMPSIAGYAINTLGIPFTSSHWATTFTASDGADSDIVITSITAATGYAVVDVSATPNTSEGSVFYGWSGSPAQYDQVYYPTADFTIVASDGTLTTDKTSGSIIMIYFDQSDGYWKPFTVSLDAAIIKIFGLGKRLKSRYKRRM